MKATLVDFFEQHNLHRFRQSVISIDKEEDGLGEIPVTESVDKVFRNSKSCQSEVQCEPALNAFNH